MAEQQVFDLGSLSTSVNKQEGKKSETIPRNQRIIASKTLVYKFDDPDESANTLMGITTKAGLVRLLVGPKGNLRSFSPIKNINLRKPDANETIVMDPSEVGYCYADRLVVPWRKK